jgi:hypothetical protein
MGMWWKKRCFTDCRTTETSLTALAPRSIEAQTPAVPDDSILYSRKLPHGPAVRVRRTSDPGVQPVTAVLEVDRRAGTPREFDGGFPPPLMIVEGETEADVLAALEPQARDDRLVAGLMREKGLR